MGQANTRAFHFVAEAARPVMGLMLRGMRGRFADRLEPTPNARVIRIEEDSVSAESLAGTGALVFEGEAYELRASNTFH